MSFKRSRVAALMLALGIGISGSLAAAPAQEPDLVKSIRARLDAYRDGDAALWATYVDDDCVCGGEKKADILRSMASRPAGVKVSYGDLLDVSIHLYGEAAVAHYRVQETTQVGGQLNKLEQWRTETYVRRAGRWVLVAGAEQLVPQDPDPIPVAREVLQRYVGRYEYTAGSVDVVTLEDGQLYIQPTGEPKTVLHAENETTFFAKGQGWRIVFRPGPQGNAGALVFRQSGQDYIATRIP